MVAPSPKVDPASQAPAAAPTPASAEPSQVPPERQALLPRARKHIAQYSILYPFKGVWFFIVRPRLWPLLRARLLPCFVLSTVVLGVLFTWTYLPQVAWLAIFQGHLAWINATFLVLSEGALIVALLFEAWFADEALLDLFDAVLIEKGLENLVIHGRAINHEGTTSVKKLGKLSHSACYSPFSFRLTFEFIFYLPVNIIPVIGGPLFLILTGRRAGQLHHWRYYDLMHFNKKRRNSHIKRYKHDYTLFGTMALTLQLVPVLSMFFLFTTATGSALWASVLYEQRMAEVQEARNAEPGRPEPSANVTYGTHSV